jgi:hypothetical protein
MPLYEVTLEQVYFGQQCINRWNYQAGSIPGGASGAYLLAVAMGAIADDDTPAFDLTTILGKMQQLQSASVTFVEMVVKTLYSVTDFYTYSFPPGTVGTGGGEPLSPVMALGYASDRTRADIRRSQKRFVGLTEGNVEAGGALVGAYQTSAQVLGVMMGNPNTVTVDGVTTVFNPVTLGREKYHPPGRTTWAYRYWPTEVEQLTHVANITQFNVKDKARSQTSRQYGRGS